MSSTIAPFRSPPELAERRGVEPPPAEAVLRMLPEAVVVVAVDGTVAWANEKAVKLLGCESPADLVGAGDVHVWSRHELVGEDGAPFDVAQLPTRRLLRGEATNGHADDVVIGWRNGTGMRWTAMSASPLADARGRVTFAVAVLRDVTEAKEREAANVRARAELEERGVFLEKFIGVVGHDLRSPISAILMAGALLSHAEHDARTARAASRIQSSARRAERLVRDLVDFVRARLGKGLVLQRSDVDLVDVVRAMIDEQVPAFPGRRVALRVEGDARGKWDGDRCTQVAANLIGNALKYSPPDSEVVVEVIGGERDVVIATLHQGEPIPDDVLPKLFDPFLRKQGESDKPARADGLSLYIVRELARAHGGSAEVFSTAAGTRIIVRLPR